MNGITCPGPVRDQRITRPCDGRLNPAGSVPEAVVITKAFAARFWPDQSPLGRRFRVYRDGTEADMPGPWP
jgi:hypothetical protein